MKLTLKRDLPLMLAVLLVIWGLWYARPIGVAPCIRNWSRTSLRCICRISPHTAMRIGA